MAGTKTLAKPIRPEAQWRNASKGLCAGEDISCEAMKGLFAESVPQEEFDEESEDRLWMSFSEPMTDADWDKILENV